MATIRIATFNAENLFARYRFQEGLSPSLNGFTINELAFDIQDAREKRITGQAIKECDADIICLQEVDSLPVLDRFTAEFLAGKPAKKYRHRILVDGNDPRHIDVAVLSRYPIRSVRSHRHMRTPSNTAELFSRDCLRIEVEVAGAVLTVFANHFKSMMGGRAATRARRLLQAEAQMALLTQDFGAGLDGDFVVLGDLNDYPEADPLGATDATTTALSALLDHPKLVNILNRLPQKDRWTHYYKGANSYKQLDYLLLSQRLDDASGNPTPGRVLKGLPWRAERYSGARFDDVGEHEPKASDHVPLFADIQIGSAVV
jgi:endonuclease/exonuclease/phosphatase family metal-dependent hydrolase